MNNIVTLSHMFNFCFNFMNYISKQKTFLEADCVKKIYRVSDDKYQIRNIM